MKLDIAIIGGGAAGLMAALSAARNCDGRIAILERNPRVGKKLLATGNGRCNLSNLAVQTAPYPDKAQAVLSAFSADAALEFFSSVGVECRSDAEGRVYPLSNAASTVLDALRAMNAHLNVSEVCAFEVQSIEFSKRGFVLSNGTESHRASRVIFAQGSPASPASGGFAGAYSLLSSLGHTLHPPVPALCPLKVQPGGIRGLGGVRLQSRASLLRNGATLLQEPGEVIFKEDSISGIVVFNLSRLAREGDILQLDLWPDKPLLQLQRLLISRAQELPWFTAQDMLCGLFHKRLAPLLCRAAQIDPDALLGDIPPKALSRLAEQIKAWQHPVTGRGDFASAQVTKGGFALDEFDPETLESKLIGGLYAAGEMLDVDAPCGGFNLHWAWASGHAAGLAAARSLLC